MTYPMLSARRYSERGDGPWKLLLLCCGRLLSAERFATWGEADDWREAWWLDVDGHERVAVLTCDKGSQR